MAFANNIAYAALFQTVLDEQMVQESTTGWMDANAGNIIYNGGKNVKPSATKGAWSNLCASGAVSVQSRNGRYTIFGKQYKAYAGAYDYYCLTKLHTAVRLHTILYKAGASLKSKKYYDKALGSPSSHGCIRLKPSAAQFIYGKIPTKTRALVY